MASVSVSAPLPIAPEKAWDALADLARWEEWLTIHQSWKSDIPSELVLGTRFTEVVSVMGMANKIEWTIAEVTVPEMVRITGTGMAGVTVEFVLRVEPDGSGSTAHFDASFTGTMIVGPIGKAVAKNAKSDLENSLAKFAELVG
ncbi:SRPBCC family protein [Rhodococcus triatomae]|uniref:Polyketide cyclase / dehydrase and lipid transport n=1 Tax=Rhodococcus triatomae TaxID=300028 RepID=A0A1G8GH81_9NOCA|nr:SRPBCC family protein [Rhodococcus triatomae]QNG20380.1 SRPBCC family protein [Rhodococcus triatomae]QNG23704.1 SRPBCC family protein [Rhodococcus triatomae]SDH93701.1 Polyketide cyclase / dehydrase and lipid transport [Rhodococcus triatomae]